ncbi:MULTISPECIES: 16S rRNA (cytidine(1402)-2'-O)-methyltransferase [Enterococcus]|uniref:Ribosomal RNA small subunit methyltransferase I n=1 Tax=Enterococcus alcedinis TaxID=1274384 RepID=A0A917JGR9_9ENTE|nr:16S rRNA (cytidine(1402)-2'-O)-methyltransferase [Enterococcus alcedinis]MBP2102247.1 16S rRNA (cytidine1402-2'-O)-methyltransferase [Enterococcus alcedinis]GGI65807.1 ribosomal RNA small subunit methyltransferase I [Enterococcus alcedinis]
MDVQMSFKGVESGILYLVPTPIGNLEDMTFRSVRILKEVALIASEDTRNTQKLLNHFEITTPQRSFHEHNYKERIPQLIELLQSGSSIAQVSDAGMPSISDPGHELVVACIEAKVKVVALPGPTAGLTALIASGLSPQPHYFHGFLPRKKKEQQEVLAQFKQEKATVIYYESPHRIQKTVQVMMDIFGETRQAVVCRELTKLHEEYLRGTLAELNDYLKEHTIKGECCLMVAGSTESPEEIIDNRSLKEQVEELIAQGLKPNDSIKEVAKRNQLKKQVVYNEYHEIA